MSRRSVLNVLHAWCAGTAVFCLAGVPMKLSQAQEASPTESKSSLANYLSDGAASVASWMDSARELRLATEAVERVVTRMAAMLETTSENMSGMSSQFDPFGFKTAFQTIQQQNETIQRLMESEIARLEKENKALRREARKQLAGKKKERKKETRKETRKGLESRRQKVDEKEATGEK